MSLLLVVAVHIQLVPLVPLLGLLQEGRLLIQKGLPGTQQTAVGIPLLSFPIKFVHRCWNTFY